AAAITGYWSVLTQPLLGSVTVSSTEIINILRVGILAALVNASVTGTVAASMWLNTRGRSRGWHTHVLLSLPAAVVIAFGAQLVLGIVTYEVTSLLLEVVIWAIAAAALLIWVRICVHNALLEEGAEHHIGANSACPECHRLVPTMLFCPSCGVARSAAPKPARRTVPAGAVQVALAGASAGGAVPLAVEQPTGDDQALGGRPDATGPAGGGGGASGGGRSSAGGDGPDEPLPPIETQGDAGQ
ncbi:MAG TPA: hypothetical protein VME46_13410, partial [Acidimicrobiales bacterium]|nr:hypothetical protein [Acidimicrobiales bacterium]